MAPEFWDYRWLLHGVSASKLPSSRSHGKHFIYGVHPSKPMPVSHMNPVHRTQTRSPWPESQHSQSFASSRHAVPSRSCLILFSNSFLLSQRAHGNSLVPSWSISHFSFLPTAVGLLGWTWAPDATSCLAALLVTSPIPGVPTRQWAGKEYGQPGLCLWTQITAVDGVAQHGGSSRPAGLT